MQFPCGQCMNCRVNRQRSKVGRMILEARAHQVSSFITLTYNEDSVPLTWSTTQVGELEGNLRPSDLVNFWKRLRHHVSDLRYYAVGEYGNESWRPHYHAILFGQDPLHMEELLPKVWQHGFVDVGMATTDSMAYTAQYTLKKMTKDDDWRLGNRWAEYSVASKDPAIGTDGLLDIAETLRRRTNRPDICEVPASFRHDGKSWPLDYWATTQIRKYLGQPRRAIDRVSVKPFDPADLQSPEELEHHRKWHHKRMRRGKKAQAERQRL